MASPANVDPIFWKASQTTIFIKLLPLIARPNKAATMMTIPQKKATFLRCPPAILEKIIAITKQTIVKMSPDPVAKDCEALALTSIYV